MAGFENSVVASAVGLSLLMKNLDLNLKIWRGCALHMQMGSAGDFILTSICTTEDISSYLNEGDGGVSSSCPSSLVKDRILKRPQLWWAIRLMTKSCSKELSLHCNSF